MVGSGDRKIVENSSLRDVFVVAGDATVLGGDSGLYGVYSVEADDEADDEADEDSDSDSSEEDGEARIITARVPGLVVEGRSYGEGVEVSMIH